MLACLCVAAATGLVLPTAPVSMPTTSVLAAGVLQNTNLIKGDVYKGGTDMLDLSSLLDSVPADPGEDKDAAGVSRISERSEKKMTPAEAQAAKKAEFEVLRRAWNSQSVAHARSLLNRILPIVVDDAGEAKGSGRKWPLSECDIAFVLSVVTLRTGLVIRQEAQAEGGSTVFDTKSPHSR